jgi:hypothetical protein
MLRFLRSGFRETRSRWMRGPASQIHAVPAPQRAPSPESIVVRARGRLAEIVQQPSLDGTAGAGHESPLGIAREIRLRSARSVEIVVAPSPPRGDFGDKLHGSFRAMPLHVRHRQTRPVQVNLMDIRRVRLWQYRDTASGVNEPPTIQEKPSSHMIVLNSRRPTIVMSVGYLSSYFCAPFFSSFFSSGFFSLGFFISLSSGGSRSVGSGLAPPSPAATFAGALPPMA